MRSTDEVSVGDAVRVVGKRRDRWIVQAVSQDLFGRTAELTVANMRTNEVVHRHPLLVIPTSKGEIRV
jgi:hypothetical protein